MCSELEQGSVIAVGRFMVGKCEVAAVCLPPMEVGLQMGWNEQPGGQCGMRDLSLQWGKGSWLGRGPRCYPSVEGCRL